MEGILTLKSFQTSYQSDGNVTRVEIDRVKGAKDLSDKRPEGLYWPDPTIKIFGYIHLNIALKLSW